MSRTALGRCRRRVAHRGGALAGFLVCLLAVTRPAAGDLHETFEAVDTTWTVGERDCALSVDVHRRVFGDAHGGQGSEFLGYRSGPGTLARIVHPVLPTRVIDELAISVWVRGDQEGVQLQARVTLPRTVDPRSGKALTYWLTGEVYAAPGHWKQLTLTQVRSKLEQVVFTLRSQLQTPIDPAEAYIDQVGLNIQTGPGSHRLWIDDLELRGQALRAMTSRGAIGERVAPAGADRGPRRRVAEFRGDVLFVNARPFSIRAVDYHGESLELIRRLGLNCVVLGEEPDAALDRRLAAHQLWWIAPLPLTPSPLPLRRRLAYLWPTELEARDADAVRHRVEQYRKSSGSTLLIARVRSGATIYSHLFDAIVLTRPVIGTTLPLDEYLRWITEQRSAMRMETPVWIALDSELPVEVQRQISALGGQDESQFISTDALELAALSVTQLGIRSIWFRSGRPLERTDAGALRRQRALRRVCQTLDLISPWTAGGKVIASVHSTSPELKGVVMRSDAARLMLAVRQAPGVACVPPAWESAPVTLTVDGVPATDEAFRLRPQGLVRLTTQQAASLRVVEEVPTNKSLALMTSDVAAIQYVASRLRQDPLESLTWIRDDLRQELEWTRLTLQRMRPWLRATDPKAQARWETVERQYKHFEQLARSQDYAQALNEAVSVRNELRRVQRANWEEAIAGLEHPAASPFCLSFYSLPLHWMWISRIWGRTWSGNQLAGGDFEDLRLLRAGGWTYTAALDPRLEPRVRVVPSGTYSGRGALQLSCDDPGNTVRRDAAPIATIESPPVPVAKGQWVRISGWVRIDRRLTGSSSGLRVVDSIGGIAMAQSMRHTDGWQQVNLYRVAVDDRPLRVTIELHGYGTVWLDSFAVQFAQQ